MDPARSLGHHREMFDPGAQGQGAQVSKHLTNQIVSVGIELLSLIDKPTSLRQYLPRPCLTT